MIFVANKNILYYDLIETKSKAGNKSMKWIEITITTTQEGLEAVSAALDAAGVAQVVLEEGSEQIEAELADVAKYWDFADAQELASAQGPAVKAYISDLPESEPLLEAVRGTVERLKNTDVGLDLGALELTERKVDDEDWANNWKAYYKPLAIGEKLLVKPSWEPVPDGMAEGRVVVEMDPGMVFGTGTHQTTRMCLEFLEKLVKPGMKVADFGCGSGILSIAALLLGADHAVGVDIDPVADQTVMENVRMNGVDEEKYETLIGDILSDSSVQASVADRGKYDIIVANIVAGIIIPLSALVPAYCDSGVPFLVSGIIREREEEVLAALRENGFEPAEIHRDEEWVAILSYRR